MTEAQHLVSANELFIVILQAYFRFFVATDLLYFFFSSSAIGADGLCCQSREFKEWHGCRSTKGVTKGKITPFLCVLSKNQGSPGKLNFSLLFLQGGIIMKCPVTIKGCVGWAGPLPRHHWTWVCFSMTSLHWSGCTITSVIILFLFCFYSLLGTDKYGFGFGGTGKKSHNKQFDSYGEVRHNEGLWFDTQVLEVWHDLCLFQEFTMHDTIGCYIDVDKGHVSFSKNG